MVPEPPPENPPTMVDLLIARLSALMSFFAPNLLTSAVKSATS